MEQIKAWSQTQPAHAYGHAYETITANITLGPLGSFGETIHTQSSQELLLDNPKGRFWGP